MDDAKRAVWQVRSDNAKKLQAFCEGISGLREAESVLSAVVAPEKSEHMEVCGEGGGAHGARYNGGAKPELDRLPPGKTRVNTLAAAAAIVASASNDVEVGGR